MSGTDGFTDSTDWLGTRLAALSPVDASLRCQVCKDFFTTPMITSCSHTFCSLCIRRYLSQEGRCPACRESDQEIKLRRNWSVEETVAQFKARREELLQFARSFNVNVNDDGDNAQDRDGEGMRPRKRRKVVQQQQQQQRVGDGVLPERRSTRSQSRMLASQDTQDMQDVQNGYKESSASQEEVQDSDDEGSVYHEEEKDTMQRESEARDGLVPCPSCGKRKKEASINDHLDKCLAGEATPSPRRSNTPQIQSTSIAYGQSKPPRNQERLPTINYSMLTDHALRKKLKDLGIPNHGSKELMRKRHTEWMNLWNANCDSLKPVTKTQLLQDLNKWERTLGRQLDKPPSGVMVKDFDRDGWQKSNKGDFDDLIQRARHRKPEAVVAKTDDETVADEALAVQHEPRSLETIFDGVSAHDTRHGHVLTNGDPDGEAALGVTVADHPVQIQAQPGNGTI